MGSVSSEKSGKEGTPTPAKKGATPAAKPAPTPKSGKKQVREIKLKLMDWVIVTIIVILIKIIN